MTSISRETRRGWQALGEDWLLYLLVLGAVMTLPLQLSVSGWVPGSIRWVGVAVAAALLGLAAARSRRAGVAVWLASTALGLGLGFVVVGRLLPPLAMIRGDLSRAWDWVWALVVDGYRDPNLPLSYGATHFVTRGAALIGRLGNWARAVRAGGASTDDSALLLLVWAGVWLASWHAAFQLGRYRRTWSAVAPLGVALLLNVGYTGQGVGYTRLYLGLILLTAVWANAGRMQQQWQRAGVGVSERLRRHMLLSALPLGALLLTVALVVPHGGGDQTTQLFWDHMGDRLKAFHEHLDRAFAGRDPTSRGSVSVVKQLVTQISPSDGVATMDEHDIRGGAPTSKEIVFWVETGDTTAASARTSRKHYWRQRTYDRYTGTGWATSETDVASFQANSPWKQVGYPHLTLEQHVTFQRPGSLAVAANEPVVVADGYSVRTRGGGDLAAFYVANPEYTVTSRVPDPTAAELRLAEYEYNGWIAERFASLPRIPVRVEYLARQIVERAGATSRYDQAVAIEAYLRGFVYDLDVEAPPDGVDVVEYYLFDAQRGYCDYAATSMVVMLRSLGIAARYASGYGQGEYDVARGVWVVRGENAHAWAEVYFPGYGWIEFEPTATQSRFARSATRPTATPMPTAEPTDAPGPAQGAEQPPEAQGPSLTALGATLKEALLPWSAGAGTAVLAALAVQRGVRSWRRRQNPQQAVCWVFERLQRHGQRLGLDPRENLTAREYLDALVARIDRRVGATAEVHGDIVLVQRLYERANYGAEALTLDESDRAVAAWRRLRRYLRRRLSPYGRLRERLAKRVGR